MPKIVRPDTLKHWGIDHGLSSYRALADSAGLSRRTMYRLIAGGGASDRTTVALLNLTGLSFDTLFKFVPTQGEIPEATEAATADRTTGTTTEAA